MSTQLEMLLWLETLPRFIYKIILTYTPSVLVSKFGVEPMPSSLSRTA